MISNIFSETVPTELNDNVFGKRQESLTQPQLQPRIGI